MSYHSFVYAWYKGEVPAGYAVDHIDNDPLNNSLDNLQLLTPEENIKKRGGGKNQFTAARENGLEVPKGTWAGKSRPNARKGKTGYRYEHTDDYLKKNQLAKLAKFEEQLETAKTRVYKYETARQSTIDKLEKKIKELKEILGRYDI